MKLFQTVSLAGKTLKNRVVMPPMTRSRSTQPGDVPNALMAVYYAQRASAGLIVSEGTQISALGKGYAWTPGIYTQAQIEGWKLVTDKVHAAGGVMFAQLWHVGRVSHPSNTEGQQPISASAIQAQGVKVFVDEDGGTLQNRIRFLKEVVRAVCEEIGADKVGVRLAPLTTLNGTVDDNPEETYLAIASMLNSFKIGYMHIAEADWDDAPQMPISFKQSIRGAFNGILIYAGKYDKARAESALSEGWADMIGFGRPFVANPDLPHRLANDLPLNEHKPDTLFGGDERGYTDYSFAK